jgi:hypothetical protein
MLRVEYKVLGLLSSQCIRLPIACTLTSTAYWYVSSTTSLVNHRPSHLSSSTLGVTSIDVLVLLFRELGRSFADLSHPHRMAKRRSLPACTCSDCDKYPDEGAKEIQRGHVDNAGSGNTYSPVRMKLIKYAFVSSARRSSVSLSGRKSVVKLLELRAPS